MDSRPTPTELEHDYALLARDRYDGDASRITERDRARLAAGEPLAYVIGWVPFAAVRVPLDSRPLIPRPETEWWTTRLIAELQEAFSDRPCSVLDLCAGSGCIGLAILHALPNATVVFSELEPRHRATIARGLEENGIDPARATIVIGDCFEPVPTQARFDRIVTNPPYIPTGRVLPTSVSDFEPAEALYAGVDGLDLIMRIARAAPQHLVPGGEIWVEIDAPNADAALALFAGAQRAKLLTDQYDRPRVVLASY